MIQKHHLSLQHININLALNTRVNGAEGYVMERAQWSGQMERATKVIGTLASLKDKASLLILIKIFTLDSGNLTKQTEKVSINHKKEANTKAIG